VLKLVNFTVSGAGPDVVAALKSTVPPPWAVVVVDVGPAVVVDVGPAVVVDVGPAVVVDVGPAVVVVGIRVVVKSTIDSH